MASKDREVGIRLSVKDKEAFERAMKSAGAEGEKALKRIGDAAKPPTTSLLAINAAAGTVRSGFAGFAAGITAGLAPLVTMVGLIDGTKAALEKFGDVADKSKTAGIDPEFFQGIGYAAKLAGIEIETTASALETYAKNAGDAAAGRGRMVTALKALDPELLKNIQRAASQEERIRLATDALEKLQSTAEKSALSNALFGSADFWKALEGGSASLDATIAKAKDLGIVISRDVIEKADELGDRFDTATEIIDNRFKEALINVAPMLVNFANWVAFLANALRSFIDQFKTMDELSLDGLGQRIDELGRKQLEIDNELQRKRTDLQTMPAWVGSPVTVQDEIDQLEARKADNLKQQAALLAEYEKKKAEIARLSQPTGGSVSPGSGGTLPPSDEAKQAIREAEALIKRLRTDTEQYADTVDDLRAKLDAGLIPQDVFNRGVAEAALKFAKSADDAGEYAAALNAIEAAYRQGLITQEQYANALSDLTERQLKAQNDWMAGLQLGLKQVADSAKDVTGDVAGAVTSWSNSLGDMIAQGVQTGKFAWQDLVKTILADIAKLVTKQTITAPIASLISSAFGGFSFGSGLGGGSAASIGAMIASANGNVFSSPGLSAYSGTIVDRPTVFPFAHGMGLMGEDGAEAILPLSRGSDGKLGVRGGANMSLTLSPSYTINGSGLSEAQLQRVLDANNRQLLQQVPAAWKKAYKAGAFG